jgi:predicted DNA-binding transcriptional regulator YafY
VPVLRDRFGRHCRVVGKHSEGEPAPGRSRARVAAPTPRDLARNLAGWGSLVEVLEPTSVQTELARIGAELVGRYPTEPHGVSAGSGDSQ